MGKPREAPDPDMLDHDEMRLYEKNAVKEKDVQTILNSLPAEDFNGIVREVLPVLTESRTTQLAHALVADIVPPPEPAPEPTPEAAPRPTPHWDGPKYATIPGNPAKVPIAGPEWSLEDMLALAGFKDAQPKAGKRKKKKGGEVGRPAAGARPGGAPSSIGRNGGKVNSE